MDGPYDNSMLMYSWGVKEPMRSMSLRINCDICPFQARSRRDWLQHLIGRTHHENLKKNCRIEKNGLTYYFLSLPEHLSVMVLEVPYWFGQAPNIIINYFSEYGQIGDFYYDAPRAYCVVMFCYEVSANNACHEPFHFIDDMVLPVMKMTSLSPLQWTTLMDSNHSFCSSDFRFFVNHHEMYYSFSGIPVDTQLDAFINRNMLSASQIHIRKSILANLTALITDHFKNASLVPYGSLLYEVGGDLSDFQMHCHPLGDDLERTQLKASSMGIEIHHSDIIQNAIREIFSLLMKFRKIGGRRVYGGLDIQADGQQFLKSITFTEARGVRCEICFESPFEVHLSFLYGLLSKLDPRVRLFFDVMHHWVSAFQMKHILRFKDVEQILRSLSLCYLMKEGFIPSVLQLQQIAKSDQLKSIYLDGWDVVFPRNVARIRSCGNYAEPNTKISPQVAITDLMNFFLHVSQLSDNVIVSPYLGKYLDPDSFKKDNAFNSNDIKYASALVQSMNLYSRMRNSPMRTVIFIQHPFKLDTNVAENLDYNRVDLLKNYCLKTATRLQYILERNIPNIMAMYPTLDEPSSLISLSPALFDPEVVEETYSSNFVADSTNENERSSTRNMNPILGNFLNWNSPSQDLTFKSQAQWATVMTSDCFTWKKLARLPDLIADYHYQDDIIYLNGNTTANGNPLESSTLDLYNVMVGSEGTNLNFDLKNSNPSFVSPSHDSLPPGNEVLFRISSVMVFKAPPIAMEIITSIGKLILVKKAEDLKKSFKVLSIVAMRDFILTVWEKCFYLKVASTKVEDGNENLGSIRKISNLLCKHSMPEVHGPFYKDLKKPRSRRKLPHDDANVQLETVDNNNKEEFFYNESLFSKLETNMDSLLLNSKEVSEFIGDLKLKFDKIPRSACNNYCQYIKATGHRGVWHNRMNIRNQLKLHHKFRKTKLKFLKDLYTAESSKAPISKKCQVIASILNDLSFKNTNPFEAEEKVTQTKAQIHTQDIHDLWSFDGIVRIDSKPDDPLLYFAIRENGNPNTFKAMLEYLESTFHFLFEDYIVYRMLKWFDTKNLSSTVPNLNNQMPKAHLIKQKDLPVGLNYI